MTRLLLVAPPVLHGAGWWSNRDAGKPHLESLAAHVADLRDVAVVELDLDDDPSLPDVLDRLDEALDEDVDIVGLSCWTSLHYLGTVAVLEHLRAAAPRATLVVGGHHATACPEDFDGLADVVVTGDGEHALRDLCLNLPAPGGPTRRIAGRPVVLSDEDPIDWSRTLSPSDETVWLALSRGCPFRCRFCLEPLRGAGGSRYSVEHALAIIETVVRSRSPRAIAFADPLFGSNRRWTEGFLAGLAERDLPVQFWAETRADLVTEELLAAFRRARFKLDFGLDTGSEVMAEVMEKSAAPARYLARSREMLRAASALDLPHGVYLLFNHPGETPESTEATWSFVQDLLSRGGPSSGLVSAQSYFHLPGVESARRGAEYAERFGARVAHPRWWREAGPHRAMATDTLPHRAWIGREHELAAFGRTVRGVNARWRARWTAETRSFLSTFYGWAPT